MSDEWQPFKGCPKRDGDGWFWTLSRMQRMSDEWRPIETAPKDRRILLATAMGIVPAKWYRNWWRAMTDDYTPALDKDLDGRDELIAVDYFVVSPVTHWMPLPNPPQKDAADVR